MWKQHIILDDNILSGKPVIKGTRISVEFIMDLLAQDWNIDSIPANYPQLSSDDVKAAVKYSAEAVKKEKSIIL